MKVETKFNFRQRVWIKELRTSALVLAVFVDQDGIQYRCRWFDGVNPKSDYFLEDELGTPPENEAAGFHNIPTP